MDPVEAEEQQTEPPDEDDEEEGYAEKDPTGRFIRVRRVVGLLLAHRPPHLLLRSYKAFDKLEGVEVAWSQSRINDSVMGCSKKMEQLNTEIQLLGKLRHKNIVKLFASWVDEDKGIVNIVTEYFTSGNLRHECQSMGHIFKNVSHGIKPAALYKVKDVEVRSFIENCLAPASDRIPASDLLRSSFLQKDESLSAPPVSVSLIEIENVSEDGDQSDSFVFRKGEFLLKGHMDVANPVVLSLRFPDPYGGFKTVEFPLDVAKDTGLSVAVEMAEQFELPHGSIEIISELIGAFMLVLIQYWRRSCAAMP
ncbi:hypothetical protein PR202_gb00462 [Eleusine coracana subsp. coracana]|uniref:non-specific serine/threonine protein kinase n=1 Tax=Eleusine coracana subsp. coracana TaxID=191504 RepID=A0AAV5DRL5_ELECO|nr:hypothetical protein PR202_gb00462 [Eleusine coracana subsp. coracana]